MFKKLEVCVFLCLIGLFSCRAAFGLGSGAFRNEVVDGEAAGKGYCFVAQADGPSAVHYNPAGLTQLKGDYVSLGWTLEAPRFECDSDGTGDTVQMQKQLFWIPNFYYVTDLETDRFRVGFSATSPYGLSTDWANDSFSQNVMTESDVEMVNFNPVIAYKVDDVISIGAGANYFVSHLSKHKQLTADASDGGDYQLKGSDEAWGYNIGLLITPSPKQRIGVSYRSEIDLTYQGTTTLDNLNATYSSPVYFGTSTYTTAMKSDSTLPQSLAIGYAYKPSERWTIETDVEWTGWSCVEEELIQYPDEGDATRLAVLNNGNPVSRDWTDAFAYGIGVEYKATDKLDLRGGFFYHETPIPSANFDTPLPDANKHGITIGLGYLFKGVQVDASYAFLKYRDRDITNDVGSTTSSNIDGTYKGYVNIAAVAFTYKY